MKKKKLLFILNPHSGKGQIKNKLLEIVDAFVKNDFEVTVYPTQRPQEAREIIAEVANEYEMIVCSGGDGTLDEVVSGMMRIDERRTIGYIPAGSTNDFAVSLKIPKDMVEAANIVTHGEPFPCDVGNMNGKYFIYIAAFGLFTDVSYETPQEWKNILGHAAYVLEGMRSLPSMKSHWLRMECNGEVIEDEFVYGMITNSTSVGGFKNMTGDNVLLDDGLFEITLIRAPKNPVEFSEIIASLINIKDSTELIYTAKVSSVNICFEYEVPWTLDGEYGGMYLEVRITNENKAVTFMVKRETMLVQEDSKIW
jgi:YegS/Rv2252/BmrU family lipid kinase